VIYEKMRNLAKYLRSLNLTPNGSLFAHFYYKLADYMIKIRHEVPAMKKLKTSVLIDHLKQVLDCPQHKIARLMGVTPLTLSHNRDQLLEELTPRTRKLLVTLYQVVRHLGPLRSDALLAILQLHVLEDEEGRRDSVVSALQQDKYALETLIQIAETAHKEYSNQWNSTSPDVSDAISVSA
jgi:hypothetical protein